MLYAVLNKFWKQLYDHLPPSHKSSKEDKQIMLGTAEEVWTNS